MKVLSLLEPWASLISQKVKQIETRSWKTSYRGTLYIHASKREVKLNDEKNLALAQLLSTKDFKYGAIIAKCKLVDCVFMDEAFLEYIKKNNIEYMCGEYSYGRYAWILEDIEQLKEPIYTNGHLSIWEYNEK